MKEAKYYLVRVSEIGEQLVPNLSGKFFDSLEEALSCIEGVDLESDRILVWEALLSGHMKVVWQFSGWRWEVDARDIVSGGLEQGVLPGHTVSLEEEMIEEEEMMKDY